MNKKKTMDSLNSNSNITTEYGINGESEDLSNSDQEVPKMNIEPDTYKSKIIGKGTNSLGFTFEKEREFRLSKNRGKSNMNMQLETKECTPSASHYSPFIRSLSFKTNTQ